ncbi:oligosaccharide flippase family protein [Arsenicicoccus cauae]|uniref:oligosaccharide flippase family protein n=1 Tax=Arsenicicoccus cauae TaxID=2663847 RepID=UPI0025958209|nr:oligosaccharide flippase family protein [uncultured Arsenicicoccus sp.]
MTAGPDDAPATPKGSTSAARVLLRGASWQSLAFLVPLALNLILTPFVFHGLGVEAYGKFLVVNSLATAMGTFDGGIGASAQRYFTIYAGRDARDEMTRLLVSLIGIVTLVSVVVFTGLWMASPAIVRFFRTSAELEAETTFLLRTMVVVVGVALVRQLFACVLYSMQKFSIPSITGMIGHAIYAAGMVWTVRSDLGLYGVAYTFMAQQVLSTVVIIPSAMRFLTRSGVRFISGSELKDFFSYAWKAQIASVLEMAGLQGDMLIVGRFAAAQVGIFGPGSQFAFQLRSLPANAAGTPMQALIGRWVGESGEDATLPRFEKLQRLWVKFVSGWVAVGVPACLFGVTEWLRLDTSLPGQVAALALVGHFFPLLAIPTILWVLTLGRPELDMRYGLVNVTLNLGLTVAFIIPFGVLGSVAATVIAQLISFLFLLRQVRLRLPQRPRTPLAEVPWAEMALTASVSYLCVYGMSLVIEAGFIPQGALALVCCGLAAAPAGIIYVLLVVGPREIKDMLDRRRSGRDLVA